MIKVDETHEIRIQYDKETEYVRFLPSEELPPSIQGKMLCNILAILIHQQCKFYNNTKQKRMKILETIFKDMADHLASMDEEEE